MCLSVYLFACLLICISFCKLTRDIGFPPTQGPQGWFRDDIEIPGSCNEIPVAHIYNGRMDFLARPTE